MKNLVNFGFHFISYFFLNMIFGFLFYNFFLGISFEFFLIEKFFTEPTFCCNDDLVDSNNVGTFDNLDRPSYSSDGLYSFHSLDSFDNLASSDSSVDSLNHFNNSDDSSYEEEQQTVDSPRRDFFIRMCAALSMGSIFVFTILAYRRR